MSAKTETLSSDFELLQYVATAEELVLGGKPKDRIGMNDGPKDHGRADELITIVEEMFSDRVHLDPAGISEKAADDLDTPTLELVCRTYIVRCQLAGRNGDFELVQVAADIVLTALDEITGRGDLHGFNGADLNSTSYQCYEAQALGYKGYALMKLKSFTEALRCLERSYELRSRPKGDVALVQQTGTAIISYADRRDIREALTVEKSLAACCRRLHVHAPLPPLTKFSRTAHLFDSGGTAVSSDDLIISGDDALLRKLGDGKTHVIIEEKIDGANMGISLSATGEVLVQNRSHYISSGDHAQFGPLAAWVAQYRSALLDILTKDQNNRAASQGLVLFGEWMVARHSIPYHKLPGQFVAYDIYDRLEKRFFSRSRFHQSLKGSGIPVVPVVETRTFGPFPPSQFSKGGKPSALQATLRNLLETRSQFRSDGGPVEGVVLRIDECDNIVNDGDCHGFQPSESQYLAHRVKIVRPDFIAGCSEGHWRSRDIEKQIVDHEFAETYLAECYSFATPAADRSDESKPPENAGLVVKYKDGESCSQVINPRRRLVVTYESTPESPAGKRVILPRNFSWLWPNEVAFSSTPLEAEHIDAFSKAFGISLVVTLTEEEPLPAAWFASTPGCRNQFVPVQNYMPPELEQMDVIIDDIERAALSGSAVLVHCGGGKGRAGTVAACLLLKAGHSGIRATKAEQEEHGGVPGGQGTRMGSDEAIVAIRRMRPGSIETEFQERFVRNYARLLWKRTSGGSQTASPTDRERIFDAASARASAAPESKEVSVTACPSTLAKGFTPSDEPFSLAQQSDEKAETIGANKPAAVIGRKITKAEAKAQREHLAARARARRRVPRYVMCMGLPGSGKTTFAERLASEWQQDDDSDMKGARMISSKDDWVVIDQDKMGRRACLDLAGRSRWQRIILDRCNPTEAERAEWMGVLHSPAKGDAALVYFSADAATCTARVQARVGHETIPEGRGSRIVSDAARRLEPPTDREVKSVFGAVETVETFEAAEVLLRRWGCL